jgi:hypothetical protein
LRFDRIERADPVKGLGRQHRLDVRGIDEFAPAVRPTVGMNDAGLFCVRVVSAIAVRKQHATLDGIEPEHGFHVRVRTACEEGEANFIAFAVDRPEVTALHLARTGPAGLDRGLVHRLDARGTNRPPRQNSCRPDRIDKLGAMMEEKSGSIRTGIQG